MAADTDLVSYDTALMYLGLESTTVDTELLEFIITGVSEYVQDIYCDRQFRAHDYTEVYDGNGDDTINLKQYPINSVDSLTIDDTVIDSEEYGFYPDTGILYYSSGFPLDRRNIEVSYNAGYELVDMPKSIQLPTLQLIQNEWDRRDLTNTYYSQEEIGDYSYTIDQRVPTDLELKLDRIKKRYVYA